MDTQEPMITFDLWFASTGRPARHKAGLMAFANTSGRRTKKNWDDLFKKY